MVRNSTMCLICLVGFACSSEEVASPQDSTTQQSDAGPNARIQDSSPGVDTLVGGQDTAIVVDTSEESDVADSSSAGQDTSESDIALNDALEDVTDVSVDSGAVDTWTPECVADQDCPDDGDLCNGTSVCTQGTCVDNAQGSVKCDASLNTACTTQICQPSTGLCIAEALTDGTKCDDGDACTQDDACKTGSCIGKDAKCECKNDSDCAALEDNNLCNGTLVCDTSKPGAFQCKVNPSTVVTCGQSKDTTCSKNTCSPASGTCSMKSVSDATSCDDGDLCTKNDQCKSGVCAAGTSTCECNKDADCGVKEDGNLCNGTLVCNTSKPGAHVCVIDPKTVVQCDSKGATACKKPVCAPKTGTCSLAPVVDGASCDDGDPCTKSDMCKSGSCVPGASTCECQVTKDCAAKEDGNLCNGTLVCDKSQPGAHKCVVSPTTIVSCNQLQPGPCEKVACDPKKGMCVFDSATNGSVCDDGDPCTQKDMCKNGMCEGG
ncbi:MAG TPA: hypothetical protein DCQ06_08440, partial [Myxococcales bacterium]|nr:hypothetical protein [Myxococcales bacterium]HAN31608.1 hypothetical protein [Myxococcales bacterium]